MVCPLDDLSFIAVDPTVRLLSVILTTSMSSPALRTVRSVNPGILTLPLPSSCMGREEEEEEELEEELEEEEEEEVEDAVFQQSRSRSSSLYSSMHEMRTVIIVDRGKGRLVGASPPPPPLVVAVVVVVVVVFLPNRSFPADMRMPCIV
jgi:hypothetical protein